MRKQLKFILALLCVVLTLSCFAVFVAATEAAPANNTAQTPAAQATEEYNADTLVQDALANNEIPDGATLLIFGKGDGETAYQYMGYAYYWMRPQALITSEYGIARWFKVNVAETYDKDMLIIPKDKAGYTFDSGRDEEYKDAYTASTGPNGEEHAESGDIVCKSLTFDLNGGKLVTNAKNYHQIWEDEIYAADRTGYDAASIYGTNVTFKNGTIESTYSGATNAYVAPIYVYNVNSGESTKLGKGLNINFEGITFATDDPQHQVGAYKIGGNRTYTLPDGVSTFRLNINLKNCKNTDLDGNIIAKTSEVWKKDSSYDTSMPIRYSSACEHGSDTNNDGLCDFCGFNTCTHSSVTNGTCDACGEDYNKLLIDSATNKTSPILIFGKGEGDAIHQYLGAADYWTRPGQSAEPNAGLWRWFSLTGADGTPNYTKTYDKDILVILREDYTFDSSKDEEIVPTRHSAENYAAAKSITIDLNGHTLTSTTAKLDWIYEHHMLTSNPFGDTKYDTASIYGTNITFQNGTIAGTYAAAGAYGKSLFRINADGGDCAPGKGLTMNFNGITFKSADPTKHLMSINMGAVTYTLPDGVTEYAVNMNFSNCKRVDDNGVVTPGSKIYNTTADGGNQKASQVKFYSSCGHEMDSDNNGVCDFCGYCEHEAGFTNGECNGCGFKNLDYDPADMSKEEYPFAVYINGEYKGVVQYWIGGTNGDPHNHVSSYIVDGNDTLGVKGKDIVVKLRRDYGTEADRAGEADSYNNYGRTDIASFTLDLGGFTLDVGSKTFLEWIINSNEGNTTTLNYTVKNGTIKSTATIISISCNFKAEDAVVEGRALNFAFDGVTFDAPKHNIVNIVYTDRIVQDNFDLIFNFTNCEKTYGTYYIGGASAITNPKVNFSETCNHPGAEKNYLCSFCDDDAKKFSEISVTINESLALNFYTTLPADEAGFTVKVDGVEYAFTAKAGNLFFTFAGIGPHQLDKWIKVEIYYNDTLCYDKVTSVYDYCLKAYRQEAEKAEPDTTVQEIVYDLLVYGQAAEAYVGYALLEIPEDIVAVGTADAPTADDNVLSVKDNGDASLRVYSASAVFANQNKIVFKIAADADPTGKVTLNGKDATVTGGENGIYIVETEALAPTQYDEIFTIELSNGAKVEYSLNTYAFNMASNADIGDLVGAMYAFGKSCERYVAAKA